MTPLSAESPVSPLSCRRSRSFATSAGDAAEWLRSNGTAAGGGGTLSTDGDEVTPLMGGGSSDDEASAGITTPSWARDCDLSTAGAAAAGGEGEADALARR